MAVQDEAELQNLVPIQITDTLLFSSTVVENDYAVWVDANYAIGARVISGHRIYEAVRTMTLGQPKNPADPINLVGDTPWWVDQAPTNKFAMFDGEVSTQTVQSGSLTVVIRPATAINSIYGAGIDTDTFRAIVKDGVGGNVIHDTTTVMENSLPPDYYEYWFSPYKLQTDILIQGLDAFTTPEITVTLNKVSGTSKIGVLALGDLAGLGISQYGASVSPKSFSYVETDDYGNTKIKKGKNARDLEITAVMDIELANGVVDRLTAVMGVPCVWIGSSMQKYQSLRSFGLGNGKVTFDAHGKATLNLSVEGMI